MDFPSPPILCRSLTIQKIDLATNMIDKMKLKSTTALIELLRINDNSWSAHYFDINENGNKILKQKNILGNNYDELKSQFGVSLLAT